VRAVISSLGLALVARIIVGPGPDVGDPAPGLVGGISRHVVQSGESLRSIGARYGVDTATITEDNALGRRTALAAGQELTIDNRHIVPSAALDGVIVVNVPQRMLFLRDGIEVFSAPVAVGSRGWQTPLSPFTVRATEIDPTWDVPASIAAEARARGHDLPSKVPPGPANPLGRYWLGLSIGSVGIHGTNAPASIYGTVTHGCIRVHHDDIAVLFGLVDVGTPGITLYEPILLVEENGEIYLEVHPDAYRKLTERPAQVARTIAAGMGIAHRIDWAAADQIVQRQDGIARVITVR
jgi:L,D-transpeptidase ErfK/SrfK